MGDRSNGQGEGHQIVVLLRSGGTSGKSGQERTFTVQHYLLSSATGTNKDEK